jgi:hypothetical protein
MSLYMHIYNKKEEKTVIFHGVGVASTWAYGRKITGRKSRGNHHDSLAFGDQKMPLARSHGEGPRTSLKTKLSGGPPASFYFYPS